MTFAVQCKVLKLPEPVAELRFAPPRKWRFDYAWPEQKLALEVQGGLFSNGRHVRGAALLREYEKLNAAAIGGWRVMFTTPQDVENGNAVLMVQKGLNIKHPHMPSRYDPNDACIRCGTKIKDFPYSTPLDAYECPCQNVLIRAEWG